MYSRNLASAIIFCSLLILASCNNASDSQENSDDTTNSGTSAKGAIKEENVDFAVDSINSNSYVVYKDSGDGKLPVVLVIPEWWGLNDYAKSRAKQLADLGYLAMAVDVYGGGKVAVNPEEAGALATPFYNNPQLTKSRIDAALSQLQNHPKADTGRAAAIGYCFGGFVVLNAAKLGSNLDAVVTFHGSLGGVPPTKEFDTKVLVCHGGSDPLVPEAEVNQFKKQMDSVGADYEFKVYPNATHAFTNPAATDVGKKFNIPVAYNGAADTASWNDMKPFLSGVLKN